MAGTIKGIVVEIGGDTSGLQKALSKVNSATSSLSKELKGVNSLLKLDPSNTQMLTQKQELLSKSIEETENKLKLLHSTYNRAVESEANGAKISEENWRNIEREIVNTENKLKQLQLQASKWNEAGKSIEAFGDKVKSISGKIDNLGSTITNTLTLPVLAIGTAAVSTGNSFEAQMSRVQAISGATKDELDKLTEQAIDLGAKTSFSASEVAAGMENLASAGFTTQEIMEAMLGLLDLAASSGAELATASEIAASAIRGFGLDASESGHVADVFAEAAARTNAQVEDMGNAMKYIAPVANTMGISLEETAAAIGIMSDAGIKGEQAGTTLRGALTRLTKPTDKMTKVMENLGISFYDNNGKMKSLAKITEMLEDATKDLTDEEEQYALTTLFGTESLSGMMALINRGSDDLNDMTKSFEKADGAAENMADTMLDNTKGALESLSGSFESAGIAIQQTLSPKIKDLAKWIQDLVDKFNGLSDEEKENIVQTGLLVAAIGPAIKILSKLGSGIGTTVKAVGTFSQAIAVLKTGAESTNTSANNLAKGITALSNPATLTAAAIATAAGVIAISIKNAEKDTKEAFSNIGTSASEFVSGIGTAKSHLEEFNSTLFASSEEQQKLQENMQEVQNGITQICKTASDERRNYTQEEITQLDEYFKKLRELKDREIEIQQSISAAISQQAEQNAQTFQGSLEEYKINSQEWINTAIQQKDKEIELINERTTQEIALLQQRFGDKATLENEEYANEYNRAIEQKDKLIAQANEQVSKVNSVYAQGYLERSKNNDGFYNTLKEYNSKIEDENNRHNEMLEYFETDNFKKLAGSYKLKDQETRNHNSNMKEIWKDMYKNMSEEQEKELGVWLAMVAQTEMYGGEISDETKSIVDGILDSYDSMSKETKKAMKNAMEPMFDEMKNAEPGLFSKASGIADGILTRLKRSFDIHSPSRETRKIFNMVMAGAEEGIDDETNNIYKQIDNFSKKIKSGFSDLNLKKDFNNVLSDLEFKQAKIGADVFNKTRTVFTTPQIVFNVQDLDEARLEQCFNYINKKFGSQY